MKLILFTFLLFSLLQENGKKITEANLCLSPATTTSAKDSTKEGVYYGLFIAENIYESETLADLKNPIRNADSLANVLTSLYTFEKENVVVLKNATKEQILIALEELIKKVTDKDKLLVFYAGHGVEKNDIGYLLPVDAHKDLTSTWLSANELTAILAQIHPKHILLMVDAPFYSQFMRHGCQFDSQDYEVLAQKTSRYLITYGNPEVESDQSIFIQSVIQELQYTSVPDFSSCQLSSGVSKRVLLNSPIKQLIRHTSLHGTGHQGGDFIFHKN